MKRRIGFLVASMVALCIIAARAAETLENNLVGVTIDAAHGGVVTAMTCRKATTFPLIVDKGAGIAGTGRFFVPQLWIGDSRIDLASVAMAPATSSPPTSVALTATLPVKDGAITWVRTFSMDADESGFRVSDTFRNGGPEVVVRLGGRSEQQAEPWRKNLRCWVGDAGQSFFSVAPAHAGQALEFTANGPDIFWRALGQYGVGFLAVTRSPAAGVRAMHHLPAAKDKPARFSWASPAQTLAKGATLAVTRAVLIDEGGRRANNPSAMITSNRTIAMVDVRAAGLPGEALPGAVTVVTARPTGVHITVTQYRMVDGKRADVKTLAEIKETLKPGRAVFRHIDVLPRAEGPLYVEAVVKDTAGRTITTATAETLVLGDSIPASNAARRFHERKLPEQLFKGTWEEIGRRAISGQPAAAATDEMRRRLAFYEKHFPIYVRMLKGAAAALKVAPERLAGLPPTVEAPSGTACMNVFFNGPDGPINAYSKERRGVGYGGLKYAKVLPDTGHRFHAYSPGGPLVSWGVNSEGLSMTAASLCPDDKTSRMLDKQLAEWRAGGGSTAPMWPWMVLATCANVDEAIALITNPKAPVAGEVNVMLVDRAGNAAKVQGWGIRHHVTRCDDKGEGFFVVGNYPSEQPDGLFKIGNWGYAANTMMRERFIRSVAGDLRGSIRLKDAFWIMETHAAGGMCQHLYDNVGGLFSNTSFIAVPRTGDLWLSHGPPCRARYIRYTLEDK